MLLWTIGVNARFREDEDGRLLRLHHGGARGFGTVSFSRRFGAVVTVVSLVVGGLALIQRLSTPPEISNSEFDGRTWRQGRGGAEWFVLLNGITGALEGKTEATVPGDTGVVSFVSSAGAATLLGTDTTLYAIEDGSHQFQVFEGQAGAAALLGDRVIISSDDIAIRSKNPGGYSDPIIVPSDTTPIPGETNAVTVVANGDSAWVLRSQGGRRVVVRISSDGTVDETITVDDQSTNLILVDGQPYVRTPSLYEAVEQATTLDASTSGVGPTVAVERDGVWAIAEGPRLTVSRDDDRQQTLSTDGPVRSIALWHGRIWLSTPNGLYWVDLGTGDAPETTSIDGVSQEGFTFYEDGGRLWASGSQSTVSIDRRGVPTIFKSLDASICPAAGCTREGVASEIDSSTTTTSPEQPEDSAATTTTAVPPPSLTPPVTLPTTTAPADSTTFPTTTPPLTTVPPSTPSNGTGVTTSAASETTASIETTVVVETTTPISTDPPPAPPPTTTDPPRSFDPYISVRQSGGNSTGEIVEVLFGYVGSSQVCPAGDSILGTLDVGGQPARQVALPRSSDGASGGPEAFVVPPGTTNVSATISLCGQSRTTQTTITPSTPAPQPQVDQNITLESSASAPYPLNAVVNASVGYSLPPGWSIKNRTWIVGPCSSETQDQGVAGDGRLSVQFTITQATRYCISLAVAFEGPDGASPPASERRTELQVEQTTTSIEAPVDTTAPPVDTTAPPVDTTAPLVDTTAPPVDTTAPP
jgi:hypothetical protein